MMINDNDMNISMEVGALLQQLGEYGYIYDPAPESELRGNYLVKKVERLDYDRREDGGDEFHGHVLHSCSFPTNRPREYRYLVWHIPDQQIKFSHSNHHEFVDDEGVKLSISLYVDNTMTKPVNAMLFTYVHHYRKNNFGLDNRGYAEMQVQMIKECAVKS